MAEERTALTVENMLRELESSYKGIDLRLVLARSKQTVDSEEWVCAFLKMLFTHKSRNEVNQLHDQIQQRVGAQDGEYLKVKLAYFGIVEYPRRMFKQRPCAYRRS